MTGLDVMRGLVLLGFVAARLSWIDGKPKVETDHIITHKVPAVSER